jgi:transposase
MLRRARIDGKPVARVVKDHGYSRPTFYEAQAAFERDGLPGLLPRKRGPRRAHKLSTAVMEFINELLGEDPTLVAAELVERVRKRFKLSVHPRSIERALEREKRGS